MLSARTFGGLNANALKYLLPLWMSPFTMVTYRLVWGAVAFWLIGLFIKDESNISGKDKFHMLNIGLIGLFGYMGLYSWGISKTTPVSCSIIMAMVPIWVFVILFFQGKEKLSLRKGIGLF